MSFDFSGKKKEGLERGNKMFKGVLRDKFTLENADEDLAEYYEKKNSSAERLDRAHEYMIQLADAYSAEEAAKAAVYEIGVSIAEANKIAKDLIRRGYEFTNSVRIGRDNSGLERGSKIFQNQWQCLKCGNKFRDAASAERAQNGAGCPKCGGYDLDNVPEKQNSGGWNLDSAHGEYEAGAAKEVVDHYKKIGWEAKTKVNGNVIEVWVKKPEKKNSPETTDGAATIVKGEGLIKSIESTPSNQNLVGYVEGKKNAFKADPVSDEQVFDDRAKALEFARQCESKGQKCKYEEQGGRYVVRVQNSSREELADDTKIKCPDCGTVQTWGEMYSYGACKKKSCNFQATDESVGFGLPRANSEGFRGEVGLENAVLETYKGMQIYKESATDGLPYNAYTSQGDHIDQANSISELKTKIDRYLAEKKSGLENGKPGFLSCVDAFIYDNEFRQECYDQLGIDRSKTAWFDLDESEKRKIKKLWDKQQLKNGLAPSTTKHCPICDGPVKPTEGISGSNSTYSCGRCGREDFDETELKNAQLYDACNKCGKAIMPDDLWMEGDGPAFHRACAPKQNESEYPHDIFENKSDGFKRGMKYGSVKNSTRKFKVGDTVKMTPAKQERSLWRGEQMKFTIIDVYEEGSNQGDYQIQSQESNKGSSQVKESEIVAA